MLSGCKSIPTLELRLLAWQLFHTFSLAVKDTLRSGKSAPPSLTLPTGPLTQGAVPISQPVLSSVAHVPTHDFPCKLLPPHFFNSVFPTLGDS